jgi:hypothetical protein
MFSAISSALKGLNRADVRIDQVSSAIATWPFANARSAKAANTSSNDFNLSGSAVSFTEGQNDAVANLNLIYSDEELLKTLLDLG